MRDDDRNAILNSILMDWKAGPGGNMSGRVNLTIGNLTTNYIFIKFKNEDLYDIWEFFINN